MRTLVVALILAFATVIAAQEPVTINQMQHPALLVKTNQPGYFVEVPTRVRSEIAITIRGVVARGVVRQHFQNTSANCIEAIYVFPLSDGAAVDTMRLRVGGRVIEGEIKERQEAAAVYEQAKSEGKHASLLEQHRPNLFTVSVASIAPQDAVDVEIEYQEIVRYADGKFSLRLPLAIGPRYSPQSSTATIKVPPLPALNHQPSPQYKLPAEVALNRVELSIDLDAGVPLGTVLSPTHDLEIGPVSSSHVLLHPRDVRIAADRDFELVWTPTLGAIPQRAAFSEVVGDSRYTLLMLFPPDLALKPNAVVPHETVFIIDTSGSMAGPSLEQARQALLTAIGRLRSSDRFNVIEFNSVSRRLFDESHMADRDNVKAALEWVQSLQSTGGTEILGAVQLALESPSKAGEMRQVIFITDGQVGNEAEIFQYIRTHLGDTRLFTIGIGAAPNSYFMRNAARFGRGTFTNIGNVNEVEEKMTALFAKLEAPVLTNLAIETNANAEVWPEKLPDLYAGEPLIVTLRTPVAATKSLGRVVATSWNANLDAPADSAQSGIAKLWARQKIDAVRDRVFTGGNELEVKAEIVKLAIDHHLVTEHTSLVAVDNTPTGIDEQSCKPELVPLEMPAGWGGGESATLPQSGTASTLAMLIGVALLVGAVVMRRL